MWNPEQQHFELGAHILIVEVEDIYFLTSLLRWGAPILLNGSYGGDITTQELINRHYISRTRTSGKKILIKAVMDGPLRTIFFTMHRVARIQGVHQASREHMLYTIEDIYFLTGLLRWGAPISMTGSYGGDITT